MKKFLITSFIFVSPLLIGLAILEYKLAKMPNSYNRQKKLIAPLLKDIEVINVGSSSSHQGIDPECFSVPGFNLANVSQTTYYSGKLAEYYVDKMPKLKLVIIPIDYLCFYRRMEDIDANWRVYFYYYYWHIDVKRSSIFDIRKYSLIYLYSPHAVLGIIKKRFKSDNYTETKYGYSRTDSTGHLKNISMEEGASRVRYHEIGYTAEHVKEVTEDFAEFLNYLDKKKIKFAFVTNPVCSTYYNNTNPEIVAMNQRIVDSFCKKYNCKYYNYFKDSRFTIDDFRDNDHMDYIGATKYSKILDSEIIRPMLNIQDATHQ